MMRGARGQTIAMTPAVPRMVCNHRHPELGR